MRYTVVWLPSALDQLARIWIQATDRQAVTAAANWIDQALRVDPLQKGRPFNGRRILAYPPLAVTFAADSGDRMVKVLQVGRR